MKQYIVIGAGRFGRSLAESLFNAGREVMLVDANEEIIQQMSEVLDNVAILDAADESALKSIGLGNFDVAIVAIGTDLRASIMATLVAKDLGVPYVISKAKDELQAHVLKKIGADKIILPEHDMGVKLAKALTFDNLVDFMELDEKHSIFEIRVPASWVGSTLKDLSVRNKFELNVTAIKRGDAFEVPVDPETIFQEGDVIVVAGNTKIIEKIALKIAQEEEGLF
ncbi:potassium channel family protein [Peptostreptococcus faecalis]|uniref:potassium channel family protein n=1 Tax=Peptostreptococcus faecalis TaxID=2045015 RepID=UPI000C79BB41|nr:TrkA family potassium uptake protein [Peptostreptococcus faecalis]